MEIQALRRRDQLLVGFTLFSMFFGAGNLIFPPQLGAQAGVDTWFAMAGLAVSAVFLPILGVIAVVRAGSLTELASRVHPAFATVFTVLIYLSIGPCLAIPRTASTSFEMAVPPFLPSGTPTMWFQFGYSLLFFAAAFLVALQPEKLTGRLGKFLCPVLLLLVGAMFVGSLVHPVGTYGPTLPPYDQIPAVQGFLTGYQTMDTIAALNFGIVIVMNIRALGVTDQGSVLRATVRAGGIATVLFLAVYSMLAHIGALSGAAFPGMTNGAVTLTNLVGAIFGHWGTVILAAIFFIACFNTCVVLLRLFPYPGSQSTGSGMGGLLCPAQHGHLQCRPGPDFEDLRAHFEHPLSSGYRADPAVLPAPVHSALFRHLSCWDRLYQCSQHPVCRPGSGDEHSGAGPDFEGCPPVWNGPGLGPSDFGRSAAGSPALCDTALQGEGLTLAFSAQEAYHKENKMGARKRAERKLCASTGDLIWVMPTEGDLCPADAAGLCSHWGAGPRFRFHRETTGGSNMKLQTEHLKLYAVTDRSWLGERTLARQVEESLAGGATMVQLREKGMDRETLRREALEIRAVCRRYGVPFLINDAAELAAEVGADGVHVGQQDMSPRQARAILGPNGIVGVSAHTVEEARAAQAEGADYLGVGAVFVTGTKENTTPVDYETLKEICAAVDIPVVAIGGVGRNNLSSLAGSGIQGVAVVSALYAQPDVRAAARSLRSQVEEILRG